MKLFWDQAGSEGLKVFIKIAVVLLNQAISFFFLAQSSEFFFSYSNSWQTLFEITDIITSHVFTANSKFQNAKMINWK